MNLTAIEKEALYQEFKERLNKETQNRTNILKDIRLAHFKRYNQIRFGDDEEHHVGAYFNGWQQITGMVSRCFRVTNVSRVNYYENGDELAKRMASELSEVFLKYMQVLENGENACPICPEESYIS